MKAVEVAGIRLMKGSPEYIQKLQDELRKTSLGHDLIRVSRDRHYFHKCSRYAETMNCPQLLVKEHEAKSLGINNTL